MSNQVLVFATQNQHKLLEVQAMLNGFFLLKSLHQVGIHHELAENQLTLEGNALQKARYVTKVTGMPCFADDTGLEVDALHGAPGVHSAYYAGKQRDARANMQRVLHELDTIANRSARFRTVIAWTDGSQDRLFEGIVNGNIMPAPCGNQGFGYDPIFQPEGMTQTFAEMDLSIKNSMSHRARAFEAFIRWLREYK